MSMSKTTHYLPVDSELASGGRRQKVIAGTGMVTPRRPVELHEDGQKIEELLPGRNRFARNHPLVRERPELFVPCDPKDAETFRYHRETAERKLRQLRTTTRTAPSTRRERFRLP